MKILEFDIENMEALDKFRIFGNSLYEGEKENYAWQANDISEDRFLKGYLCYEGEEIVARAALYSAWVDHEGRPVLYFGNFEASGLEAGKEMLSAVIRDKKTLYAGHALIGPVNGSTWKNYRIALNNFSSAFPMDIVSKDFYPGLFSSNGFEILYRFNTNVQTRLEWKKPYVNDAFRVVYFNEEQFSERLEEIYEVTMEAFSHAPFFTIVDKDSFIEKYRVQMPYIDTSLVPFALDGDGSICGYCSCYMGYDNKSLVLKTLARKQGKPYAGIGRILSQEAVRNTIDRGAESMFHALMHESNDSNSLSAYFYGEPFKHYAVYILAE
jgi:hypothetical protein